MSSPKRGILLRLVIVVAVLAAMYGISKIEFTSSEGKSFRIERARVGVEVRPDASLQVTERLRFDFNGDFFGAYRDIPIAAGVTARNISVSEPDRDLRYAPGGNTRIGSFDQPGRFGAEQIRIVDEDGGPTAGFRVVWHYRASDEDRTFVLRYDIEGAAIAYDDVVQVPWAVWGSQWEFWLDELDAGISLAAGDAEPVQASLDPPTLRVSPELGPGSAAAEVDRVPAGEQVVLEATFPRESFASVSGARVERGDGLEKIRAERDEAESGRSVAKLAGRIADHIVPLGIGWTLLMALAAGALYWRARERPAAVPRHLPEPPEDIPPALAFAIAHEGAYEDRLVLATLLDLVDRGYYETTPSEGKDLDLVLSEPEGERPEGELTDYEERTLDFFDRLLEEGPGEIGQLKDRVPEHSSSWRERWQKLNSSLDRAEEGEIGWDRDLVGARFLLAVIALAGYAVLIVGYFVRTHYLLLPLAFLVVGMVVIYLLPARYLKRLDPSSRERSARWASFARWTRDFPRLEDDPPATLKLWRRILVYSVAMGTADRVIESGRIPAPVVSEAQAGSLWLLYSGDSGMTSSFTSSFDGFASGFSSHVAPESSGGGGFSGGGGGASGGGGGGAW